jgi:hypothetical protein
MASTKYPRKRAKGPTSVDFWNSPSYRLRDMLARDAAVNAVIATGDLASVAAWGRHYAEELAAGTAAYPNVSAQLLENLRVAYAFFASGTMPVEEAR